MQDELKLYLLSFVESNLTAFIRTADMKGFVAVLFSCFTGPAEVVVKAERILDTIVELQGEGFLERAVRELKINAPESYLNKWGI